MADCAYVDPKKAMIGLAGLGLLFLIPAGGSLSGFATGGADIEVEGEGSATGCAGEIPEGEFSGSITIGEDDDDSDADKPDEPVVDYEGMTPDDEELIALDVAIADIDDHADEDADQPAEEDAPEVLYDYIPCDTDADCPVFHGECLKRLPLNRESKEGHTSIGVAWTFRDAWTFQEEKDDELREGREALRQGKLGICTHSCNESDDICGPTYLAPRKDANGEDVPWACHVIASTGGPYYWRHKAIVFPPVMPEGGWPYPVRWYQNAPLDEDELALGVPFAAVCRPPTVFPPPPPSAVPTGELFKDCDGPSECTNGLCYMYSANGRPARDGEADEVGLCVPQCDGPESCPSGFSCVQHTHDWKRWGDGRDLGTWCKPGADTDTTDLGVGNGPVPVGQLWKPCNGDGDCDGLCYVWAGSHPAPEGSIGEPGICYPSCDADDLCPTGFECRVLKDRNQQWKEIGKWCTPRTRTVTSCRDIDKDHFGIGRCRPPKPNGEPDNRVVGTDCQDGNANMYYDPEDPNHPWPEYCGTKDYNCDGFEDAGQVIGTEAYASHHCSACGDACEGGLAHGHRACDLTAETPRCAAECDDPATIDGCELPPAERPAGLDCGEYLDCDGDVSNGCEKAAGSAGNVTQIYTDSDGDGHGDEDATARSVCIPEGEQGYTPKKGESLTADDCDDDVATVHPAAEEICDKKDNDCNGVVDDLGGGAEACIVPGAKGECTQGTKICSADKKEICQSNNEPAEEVCDGLDNDCDGIVDNIKEVGCQVDAKAITSNTAGVGRCSRGALQCTLTAGTWTKTCKFNEPIPEPPLPAHTDEDENCDGYHGDAQSSVFVSPSGNERAAGTFNDPVQSLQRGISLAQQSGKKTVLVQAGQLEPYPGILRFQSGISVMGGYDRRWLPGNAKTSYRRTGRPGSLGPPPIDPNGPNSTMAIFYAKDITEKTEIRNISFGMEALQLPNDRVVDLYGGMIRNAKQLELHGVAIVVPGGMPGLPGENAPASRGSNSAVAFNPGDALSCAVEGWAVDASDATPVSCGGHTAQTCGACPQDAGPAGCGGDCAWRNGACVPVTNIARIYQAPFGGKGAEKFRPSTQEQLYAFLNVNGITAYGYQASPVYYPHTVAIRNEQLAIFNRRLGSLPRDGTDAGHIWSYGGKQGATTWCNGCGRGSHNSRYALRYTYQHTTESGDNRDVYLRGIGFMGGRALRGGAGGASGWTQVIGPWVQRRPGTNGGHGLPGGGGGGASANGNVVSGGSGGSGGCGGIGGRGGGSGGGSFGLLILDSGDSMVLRDVSVSSGTGGPGGAGGRGSPGAAGGIGTAHSTEKNEDAGQVFDTGEDGYAFHSFVGGTGGPGSGGGGGGPGGGGPCAAIVRDVTTRLNSEGNTLSANTSRQRAAGGMPGGGGSGGAASIIVTRAEGVIATGTPDHMWSGEKENFPGGPGPSGDTGEAGADGELCVANLVVGSGPSAVFRDQAIHGAYFPPHVSAGSDICLRGQPIPSEPECKLAADRFGKSYAGAGSVRNAPSGCYYLISNNDHRVGWNSSSGAMSPNGAPICTK